MKEIIQLNNRKDSKRRVPGLKKSFDKKIIQLNKMKIDDTWKFFQKLGFIDGNRLDARNYDGIHGVWQDEPCFIIGGGPALKEFISEIGFDFLNDKHTIGINHIIEDYDNLEWFFFLDQRFLEKTTYNLNNFIGRIFAQCTTGLKQSEKITLYYCTTDRPGNKIQDGLFSPNLSGLAALNLAILTGANPVYLLGYGMGSGASEKSYHYKEDYTGEVKKKEIFEKFIRVNKQFEHFCQWAHRIMHVTEGDDIPVFKKMRIAQFKKEVVDKSPTIKINQKPTIVHCSFSDNVEVHADITRYMIKECFGNHKIIDINKGVIPKADLYIFEHFQSTNQAIIKFPYKHKAIDIVHTVNCIPPKGFKKVISLTQAWKQILKGYFIESDQIYGGIDIDAYKDICPDYDKKVFGRITRWSPSKIHPGWNRLVKEILEDYPDSKCLMYVDFMNRRNRETLKHERMIYDESCKINMFKGDFLKNLSVYVHANGSFKETLSFAIIEAMATGLPIVYLAEGSGVIGEVVGGAGVECKTIQAIKEVIIEMLKNRDYREEYGKLAKERSKFFSKYKMVKEFNRIIKECLK